MRIIYLHQYFATPQMSGGTRSYEMARRMVAAGHDVHMVCSDTRADASGGMRVDVIDGINVHWLPVSYDNAMGIMRRLGAFAQFAIQATRYASKIDADVVFATSTPLTIALPGVMTSRRLKVPMVFEVRDLWPEVPIAMGALKTPVSRAAARRLERWAYANSEAIIALSPGMAEGVRQTGYPATKISCIPNSSDTSLFDIGPEAGLAFRAARSWLQDRPLVTYAGTFGKANGVGYLVELAEAMKSIAPDVRFLAVGRGAEYDQVVDLAKSRGVLGDNLFIEPALPKEQIPALLSASTVCTSLFIPVRELWHNSANKFFDALAAGRPLAVNHGGWLADLLIETKAGIVLDANDLRVSAARLHGFISDKQALKTASDAARNLAYSRFSRDLLARQLISVLESVAASGGKTKQSSAAAM